MAIGSTKVCHACREVIKAKATICPYCRTKQASSNYGLLAGIVVVGIFAVVAFGSHSGSSSAGNSQTGVPSAQSDDAAFVVEHGNDPKALDERFSNKAQAECSSRADNYLRSIASHDFAWDEDAQGWMGVRFDKFSLRSPGLGMLSLLSTRAKLSNGFGAFQHVDIYCLYNAASGEVARFAQSDPADDVVPVPVPKAGRVPVAKPTTEAIYTPPSGNTAVQSDQPSAPPPDDNGAAP